MIVDVNCYAHDDYLEVVVKGNFFIYEVIEKFSQLLICCQITGL